MDRAADLRADYERLGLKLEAQLARVGGLIADGHAAAAFARERRLIAEALGAFSVEGLRSDYEALGQLLKTEGTSAAASLTRERRLIGEKLEQLEPRKEVALVDELAAKRAGAGSSRPPARRTKSG